jgi:hypothetical protein
VKEELMMTMYLDIKLREMRGELALDLSFI